jgi:hypothetical protein
MNRFGPSITKIIPLAFVLFSSACTTTTPPSIQQGPDAEVSFDGLHKVDNPAADLAWAREDFDLSGYTKLLPVSAGFEYTVAENRGRNSMERNRGGPFFISDAARTRFETLARDIFQEEFENVVGWEFVTEPGPDVLIVRGAILNVTSYVPPDNISGRSEIFISAVGNATLVLELRDSESGSILARSIDRRVAQRGGGQMFSSNSVTNSAEVRRLIRFWASRLVEGLNGFADGGRGNLVEAE